MEWADAEMPTFSPPSSSSRPPWHLEPPAFSTFVFGSDTQQWVLNEGFRQKARCLFLERYSLGLGSVASPKKEEAHEDLLPPIAAITSSSWDVHPGPSYEGPCNFVLVADEEYWLNDEQQ